MSRGAAGTQPVFVPSLSHWGHVFLRLFSVPSLPAARTLSNYCLLNACTLSTYFHSMLACCLPTVYACLHTVYPLSNKCSHTVYPLSTAHPPIVCQVSIHCPPTAYPLSTYCLYSVYRLCTHCPPLARKLSFYRPPTTDHLLSCT